MVIQSDSQDTQTIRNSTSPTTPTDEPSPQSTSELRKRLREDTQQPPARKRRTKKTAEEIEVAKLVTPSLAKLDRLGRWMTFLTASHALYSEAIEEVYGKDVDRDGYEWHEGRKKLYNDVKGYKHRVITRVIEHVRSINRIEAEKRGSLFPDLTEALHLHKQFMSFFTNENFFEVFYYMDGYLDIDKSSKLGQYYVENLYANLCTRAKAVVDYYDANPDSPGLDKRKELQRFYATMTTRSEFDQVDKSCFKETRERTIREKSKRKFEPALLADADPNYIMSGPPPAKAST